MRLCATVLAIAVLSPLHAFAQAPADQPPPPPPGAVPPPPPPAATDAPPPAAPPPPAAVPAAPVVAGPPITAAQEKAPATAPAPTWKDMVTLEGLVDAYYQYNFTADNSLAGPTGVRNFDLNSNTFTLNYTKIGLGIGPDPVGLRIDVGYGATAWLINGTGYSGTDGGFFVQQAYATVTPVGGLTLDLGKFVTTAGAEVIEANKNWLYSRSILFFNIPLLHTGFRATYKVSDALTLQASIVNGWNGLGYETDLTADKTYGVSVNFTAPTGTNVIATGYFGKGEPILDTTTGAFSASPDTRVVADLVVAQTIGALGLNLNIDYVNDKAAAYDNFFGVAVMGRAALNDHLALAARGEFARNGVEGADATTYAEGTLGLAVPVGGHYEFRAELRYDHSNTAIFNGEDNQFTGTGAFLAWF